MAEKHYSFGETVTLSPNMVFNHPWQTDGNPPLTSVRFSITKLFLNLCVPYGDAGSHGHSCSGGGIDVSLFQPSSSPFMVLGVIA